MKYVVETKATVAWLILVALTLAYWSLGVSHSISGHRQAASLTIIFVAAFKVRLVGIYFMALREAPWPLRGIFECYCAILPLLLTFLYLRA